MLTVHHLNNSRSQRVLWLLEELGLPYEIVAYQRDPQTMLAPESLRAVHPLGKSPVVTTGDGQTLAESGAIVQLMCEAHEAAGLMPPRGSEAYRQFVYWLHYAEGSLMPPLLLRLVFDNIHGPRVPFFIRPIAKAIDSAVTKAMIGPRIAENLSFIDAHLGRQPYFTGEAFSGADIQMTFPLEAGGSRADLSPYPNILAFLKKVKARDAYQRALARGGQYDYA